MPELKPGWQRVKFGEIAENVNDRVDDPSQAGVDRYVGLEHLDPESLTIHRWGTPDQVESTKLRFHPGDIIFGKRRAYQRKLAVADFKGICSAHAMVLRARPGAIVREFLPFFMQSDIFMERAQAISVGSLSPTINWKTLAREEFALPPLEDQGRLTTMLVAMKNVVNAQDHVLAELDQAEAALLIAEFGRYSPKETRNWPRLATLAVVHTGIAKGRRPEAGKTVELPYLRVANVKDGHLDLSEIQQIVVESHRVHDAVLQPGDVLMTEGGDLDKLGRGTVWQGEIEGCTHQNHVFAVRVDATRLNPWYVAALARSTFGRGYFQKCAKRTSNLASVNKREVEACPIPARTIEQQHLFVDRWRKLRHVRSEIETRTAQTREMQSVLLRSALEDD